VKLSDEIAKVSIFGFFYMEVINKPIIYELYLLRV